MSRFACLAAALLIAPLLVAPACAAAPAVEENVVRVELPGRTIAALASRLEGATPQRVVMLLPGNPGIMRIESPTSFEMGGNFVVRSRRDWLAPDTLVIAVDAPSDEWCCFGGGFRAGSRYAEDLRALRAELDRRHGTLPFNIVGTSEGSVTAYYAARALQRAGDRVVFTASLFNANRNTAGLAGLDVKALTIPALLVHHAEDPCGVTPYAAAKAMAERTGFPLITVRHANRGSGPACQARTQHGFIGVEADTVAAIDVWLRGGTATDVNK